MPINIDIYRNIRTKIAGMQVLITFPKMKKILLKVLFEKVVSHVFQVFEKLFKRAMLFKIHRSA